MMGPISPSWKQIIAMRFQCFGFGGTPIAAKKENLAATSGLLHHRRSLPLRNPRPHIALRRRSPTYTSMTH